MQRFDANLFSRKWFCTPKKIFDQTFLKKDYNVYMFTRKRFCNHKNFASKLFFKYWVQTCFRGNDFATINHFLTKKQLMKNYGAKLFSRKWFWTIKHFGPKIVWRKIWCKPASDETILHTKKNFRPNIFEERL